MVNMPYRVREQTDTLITGGIVDMAGMPHQVWERTNALDGTMLPYWFTTRTQASSRASLCRTTPLASRSPAMPQVGLNTPQDVASSDDVSVEDIWSPSS
jgi:hypothetical protein